MKARQNLRKRGDWFENLAVAEKDPAKAADYTIEAARLDKRRRNLDPLTGLPNGKAEGGGT